jgi:hypothetical protein
MNRTINRRAALASTAALAAICPLPLQAAETDAEIVRLYAAFLEAEKRDAEAYAAYDQASGDRWHRWRRAAGSRCRTGLGHRRKQDWPS